MSESSSSTTTVSDAIMLWTKQHQRNFHIIDESTSTTMSLEAIELTEFLDSCKYNSIRIEKILQTIRSRGTVPVQNYFQTLSNEGIRKLLEAYTACESFIVDWMELHKLYMEFANCVKNRLHAIVKMDMYRRSRNIHAGDVRNTAKWDKNPTQQTLQTIQEYKAMRNKLHGRLTSLEYKHDFFHNHFEINKMLGRIEEHT